MGLTLPEFNEVIGRLAWFVYDGTESESVPMSEKILTVLDQLLALVPYEVARSNRFELKEPDDRHG